MTALIIPEDHAVLLNIFTQATRTLSQDNSPPRDKDVGRKILKNKRLSCFVCVPTATKWPKVK